MIIGIDASNLRAGGGVTHLIELLRVADPKLDGFEKIIVWVGEKTQVKIEKREWLILVSDEELNKSLLFRVFWQRFKLRKKALKYGCDVLFIPGGADASGFKPMVTMSRNMLPFEWKELKRYGWSFITLKLILLRYSQIRTFRKANGLIFLTSYANNAVLKITGPLSDQVRIIPHGINKRFFIKPRHQRPYEAFTEKEPCRILYVSIIDVYKHQWNVVKAVDQLRMEGFHVTLRLIGPQAAGMSKLRESLKNIKSGEDAVNYMGAVSYDDLHSYYKESDISVFASSCENMPNILLEGMAAGLPTAASSLGPTPEILSNAGLYFNPEKPSEIADVLRQIIKSQALRIQLAEASFQRAAAFSWERCARETFGFLSFIAGTAKTKN